MSERWSRAGTVWRMFVILVLTSAAVPPIYLEVTDGVLGLIFGLYVGLVIAAVGLMLLFATFVVESVRRAKQTKPQPPEIPEARINRR